MSPRRERATRADWQELRAREEAHLRYLESTGELAAVTFRIQRVLRKPSEYFGMHWREKNRERKRWQGTLTNALVLSCSVRVAQDLLTDRCGLPGAIGERPTSARRVTIERLVPSARNFIHDDDNLAFSCKPLLDALKQLGLIRDDKRTWCERIGPRQAVSDDGTYWTVITIERLPVAAVDMAAAC